MSFWAGALRAGDRIEQAAEELRSNDDFRVRTQAALALGAARDKRAVKPLCAGLEDTNTTVRAAAAAALGKLALGGADCLKERLEGETNVAVKSVLERALEKVKVGQRPAVTAETRFYVAIGPVTDKTGRSGAGLDELVRAAMVESAAGGTLEGAIVAPQEEKSAEAKTVLGKFKQVRAFFLWPKALPPDYAGGKLTVRFEVSVFTYPGKALKGTIPLKLTLPDVASPDRAAEDDLLKRAAGAAFERFAQNVERFQ